MIVDPDFLSHWKTQMLIVELNDKAAPLYVISLWAHCQQRRQDRWDIMPPNALKAICRYEGEASKLRSALERCGFLDVNGEGVIVHGWSQANAKLVAQWENGKRGGRPGNPTVTQAEPNGNPRITQLGIGVTHGEPIERIGEDRIPIPAKKEFPKSEHQRRAEKLFNRREATVWDGSECKAWEKAKAVVSATVEEDWKLLEWFFALPAGLETYRRRDLATLLNNWGAEIDRARDFHARNAKLHAPALQRVVPAARLMAGERADGLGP